jgi:nitrogen fixation protein FixH
MSTLTFDTHEFVKKLTHVGFSEEQAETLTELQKTTVSITLEQAKIDYELDDLATKRDLKELETALKRDIKELELTLNLKIAETQVTIANTKAELIRWVVAVGVLQITIITGLILRLTGKL